MAAYALVISSGITSETPNAIASTALILVDIPNLSAVFFTSFGDTSS